MPETLRRWLADFTDTLGHATLLRYGGGALVSQLPQRLEQDSPAPRDSARQTPSRAPAGIAPIDRLVRHLDGG